MKHLLILTAVGIAAAFGWRHLHNIALETEQSRSNRSQSGITESKKTQSFALIDPAIARNVVLRRQQVMKSFWKLLFEIDRCPHKRRVTWSEPKLLRSPLKSR